MPAPWRTAFSSSAPTASRIRAGVTRASSRSGTRTLRLRPAARSRGCHSSTTPARVSRRSVGSAPAARAARAACSSSSSTPERRSACSRAASGLLADGRVGVRGQLVEAQLQRREPAAHLVGDVADEVALALDQLGERARGRVEHVGDAVELGDAVPVRRRAEVARAEPGGAVGDVAQRLGEAPGGDGRDHGAGADRQHHEQQHDQRDLQLLGAQQLARLGQGDHGAGPDRQRLGDRVGADVARRGPGPGGRPPPASAARATARRARGRPGRRCRTSRGRRAAWRPARGGRAGPRG